MATTGPASQRLWGEGGGIRSEKHTRLAEDSHYKVCCNFQKIAAVDGLLVVRMFNAVVSRDIVASTDIPGGGGTGGRGTIPDTRGTIPDTRGSIPDTMLSPLPPPD